MEVLVFSVTLILLLRALSSGLKRIHFPPNYTWIVELTLGVAAVEAGILTGALVISGVPAGAPMLFFGAVAGAIAGLSASGLYNNTKAITGEPGQP